MFTSSTSAILTLAVVVSLIQPCPTPPLLLLLPAIGEVADAGIATGAIAVGGAGTFCTLATQDQKANSIHYKEKAQLQ